MNKYDIETPAILVDLDILDRNIERYQSEADRHRKELWPMLKTHKSTEIIKKQIRAGANGVLCGTMDEAEAAALIGVDKVMYAYPLASPENIRRAIDLTGKCDFILRIDDLDSARLINEVALEAGVLISYTIIIDVGLGRFGIRPEDAVDFAKELEKMKALRLRGISTHPGHVYSASKGQEVEKYVNAEVDNLKRVSDDLKLAGFEVEYVTSGSTPTFWGAIDHEAINVYHPGNYVFHDVIQISLDIAKEEDCALSLLTTIVSNPREGVFITDGGSKCLGLDQGAHGNSSIKGFGMVKGHPEILVASLSEEVGKLTFEGETSLKVGDKIEVIPNHSCSSANFTSYLVGTREGQVKELLEVDIRGNSTKKNIGL